MAKKKRSHKKRDFKSKPDRKYHEIKRGQRVHLYSSRDRLLASYFSDERRRRLERKDRKRPDRRILEAKDFLRGLYIPGANVFREIRSTGRRIAEASYLFDSPEKYEALRRERVCARRKRRRESLFAEARRKGKGGGNRIEVKSLVRKITDDSSVRC